ncbi:Retrovirus-related Pol polyprotein from transposon RE1 [Vitis vinifera]|uniref:Retrovirus-related Pol polyprotein from transposon RE1 n=1 Tax=Vitis vinifera TaxID=29760 RepID=A0A438FXN0_VITVI|nr:Retrovirus-related Pol polyprotein from transposon RE1 [Vitis vinifera]
MSDISNESTTVPQPSLNNPIITDSSKINPTTSKSHSIQITTIRLNGDNFLRWSQSVRMYIRGRGKMGYLTREKKAPAVDDPNYAIWDAENSMVMSWLVNSMEEDISSNYMCYPIAQELWENVNQMYSNLGNQSQIFELTLKLGKIQQGEDNITKYFNSSKRIWQDLDLFNTYEWKSTEDGLHHKKTMEDNQIFKFLAGLNVEFDELEEESRRNVMLGKKGPGVAIEGSTLVTTSGGYNKAETKPSRAIIPTANEAETSPFTTEQMEHLLALLKSNLTSGTSSVSLAHTGNELYALSCRFKSTPWIIDSGASDHMTNSSNMFESYSPCPGNKKVRIADGNFSPIAGKGLIKTSEGIDLKYVLHVPKLTCNLLSISKLSRDSNCCVIFYESHCIFQDQSSGKTIGSARIINGNPSSIPTHIHASSSSVTDLSLPSHFGPSPEIFAPKPGLGLAPIVPAQDLDIDLPIALRKGTRACTKHPIAKYISYSNLSDNYRVFTTNISKLVVPKNIQVALDEPSCKLAMFEETSALKKNGTWEVVDLQREKEVVGRKWVFTIKSKADKSVERYKARLVANGFTQTYGIDYQETFAPVAKINSIRVLLSLAVNSNWPLHQLDVKNVFLNGDLEEEAFMSPPPGFEESFGVGKVCKLKKSLYGLKQSPRAWFECFGKKLKGKLAEEFEIKDLGALKYFLGMEFARSKEGIFVNQRKYVLDLLDETSMLGCKPAETPIEPNVKLQPTKTKNVKDQNRYQRLVGRLIYLSHTRPDIAFSRTPCRGLLFKSQGHLQIETYTDADWAGSIVDRRSTSGYCSFVDDNLVTWRSKKQNMVAKSSAEAEFRVVAHGICEIMWIRRLLEELKMTGPSPMKLYCDNKATILVAHNPVLHDRTKHVEVDKHFIKEKIDNGLVCMTYIPTEEQVIDVFTKGLQKRQFDFLVGKLAMEDIFKPA